MIQDVDESIRTLIRQEGLGGSDVEVTLEAPTTEWSARRSAPTVDLYLYDIREELRRRSNGKIDVLDAEGRVTSRASPPRYYRLSYLATAWTQRPEDEHRLLSSILACLIRYERLPDHVLQGELEGQTLPIQLNTALPPAEDRAISDLWTALGGELKPSLDVTVIVPFDLGRHEHAGPPVLEPIRLDVENETVRARNGRPGATSHRGGAADADRTAAFEEVRGGNADLQGRRFKIRDTTHEAAAAGTRGPSEGDTPPSQPPAEQSDGGTTRKKT